MPTYHNYPITCFETCLNTPTWITQLKLSGSCRCQTYRVSAQQPVRPITSRKPARSTICNLAKHTRVHAHPAHINNNNNKNINKLQLGINSGRHRQYIYKYTHGYTHRQTDTRHAYNTQRWMTHRLFLGLRLDRRADA